jgi:hypothetical protein
MPLDGSQRTAQIGWQQPAGLPPGRASAVDLKFLSIVQQGPYRNFKSKTTLET